MITNLNNVKDKCTAARSNYDTAKELMQNNKYAAGIDKLHDCVEQYSKALLDKYGISYPPKHNVSDLLLKLYSQYAEGSLNSNVYKHKVLPVLISTHIILSNTRNYARYGLDPIPNKYLFNESMAEGFFKMVDSFRLLLNNWIDS